jgi:hypothetical protein
MVKLIVNPSDVLIVILIAAAVVDIVQMRVEIRKLRDYKRATLKMLDPMTIEIKCDNADALLKIEQVTVAAKTAADEIAKLNGSLQ